MYKIGEQIRGIAGYADGYGVDELGKVYTFKQGRRREVKQHDHKGYQRVFLFRNNERKTHFVHRLVAEAFIKNVDVKEFVNHKDGNKRNNKVDNLEWCTRAENQQHSRDVLGNTNLGNRNGNHGYRKSRFYPSEAIRSRLIELGIPRVKHDIVQLGEMLPPLYLTMQTREDGWCVCPKVIADERCDFDDERITRGNTEADARAKMLIYLAENGLLDVKSLTNNKGNEVR